MTNNLNDFSQTDFVNYNHLFLDVHEDEPPSQKDKAHIFLYLFYAFYSLFLSYKQASIFDLTLSQFSNLTHLLTTVAFYYYDGWKPK